MGLVTGSGMYRNLCSAPVSLKVKPYCAGMLNTKTIDNAEQIDILVAVREWPPDSHECIATVRCSKHCQTP